MEKFDRVLMDFMHEQRIPGASFILSHGQRIVYRQGYGVAGPGRLVTSSSMFRIASITKPITAMAVMKAVEDGRIQLEQKVFYPGGILCNLKPAASVRRMLSKVTVRDLLQHSGGWDRDEEGDVVFLPRGQVSGHQSDLAYNEALAQHMMGQKLQFPPGKRHTYSNFGYLLLGLILEKVYEMMYEDVILSLLHTTDTEQMYVGQESRDRMDHNEVEYFDEALAPVEHISIEQTTVPHPQYGGLRMQDAGAYGGLVASTSQLLRLFQHLDLNIDRSDRILSSDTITQMLACPPYESGSDWYGLGLDLQDEGQSWGHTGSMDGSSGTFYRDKSSLTWILLFNACSKETDLDGVVKFGLSLIKSLLTYSDLTSVVNPIVSEVNIVSENRNQIVQLMIPLGVYQDTYVKVYGMGYALISLDVFHWSQKFYVNFVWCKNNSQKKHLLKHWVIPIDSFDIPENNFVKYINDKFVNGWRVQYLSTSALQNSIVVMVLLVQSDKSSKNHIMTYERTIEYLDTLRNNSVRGYFMILQSMCMYRQEKFIIRIYESKTAKTKSCYSIPYVHLSPEDFMKELRVQGGKKRGLLYCNFCGDNGKAYISALWSKRKKTNCYQRFGVSRYPFLYELVKSFRNNIPLEMVSAYHEEGHLNFAGIWTAGKL